MSTPILPAHLYHESNETRMLARNHQTACASIHYLSSLLAYKLPLPALAQVLYLRMLAQYAASRTDYLLQCRLNRLKSTPFNTMFEPPPEPFGLETPKPTPEIKPKRRFPPKS